MAALDTILEEACSSEIAFVTSNIKLLQIIAQLLNPTDMTVDEINEAACTSGIADETSPQRLLVIIAQLLQGAGGGGIACASVVGAGDPNGVVSPACAGQFFTAVDLYGPGQNALFQATSLSNSSWVQWV